MPKQNRPLIRDGRLQPAPKKRTDRSYLRTSVPPPPAEMPETPDEGAEALESIDDAVRTVDPPAPTPERPPTPERAATAVASRRYVGAPAAARAIQQQGVRKRRDVDVTALAMRDTRYAMHELRRIIILATMVIVTLIVLGIVLR